MRPYDLVYVREDDRTYVGEVMSYPIPGAYSPDQKTIMVRSVPGYPATLKELNVDQLREVDSDDKWYVHYARVAGSGSFPIDMLRHEQAVPLNFALLDEVCTIKTKIDSSFGLGGLIIAQMSQSARAQWAHARWSSFLWGRRSFDY